MVLELDGRQHHRHIDLGDKMRRIVAILSWTTVLIGIFYLADRGIFGPVRKPGWQAAARLNSVPPNAGTVKVPAYLPSPFSWPPARIFYRTNPSPGWWVEISPSGAKDQKFRVWLGRGPGPYPDALGPLQDCLVPRRACPTGWHSGSTRLQTGEVILMISNVDRLQATRILEGLKL